MIRHGIVKSRLSSFRIIILGFAGVILFGALLLTLPFSSADGQAAPFGDALFTSVSGVCVTGLVVRDTAAAWSGFGQGVILLLIQIGGLGVMTVAAAFAFLSGRKISLMQRSVMQEAISAPAVGGIVRLTHFVLKGTLLFEGLGTLLLLPPFCRDFGVRGVWIALFTSVSAFCNAGFDLMGTPAAPYRSLTAYAADPLVVGTVAVLIVAGGIGFLTWEDVFLHRHRLKKYSMQSKVILLTTALLLLIPFICYSIFDYRELSGGDRFLAALFQSVTPRTAGFNTTDLTALTGAGRALMIVLMLVGGSPGSTAGGMKTTTLAVLFLNAFAVFRKKNNANVFGRRLDDRAVKDAATILTLYLTLFVVGALLISAAEGLPVSDCLFETASAVGTVGLTLGITPGLGLFSRVILMLLMFLGRVGGLTLIFAVSSDLNRNLSRLPKGKISVG